MTHLIEHSHYNSTSSYIASSNLISDIQQSDGNKTFILRDFVTTGDAVRIKLPFKDNGSLNQYIWLENHKIGQNGKIDYLEWSNTHDCRPIGQAGIYSYIQVGKDVLESTSYGEVYPSGQADNLKMLSAEGNFNMLKLPDQNNSCVGWGMAQTGTYLSPNSLSGNNDIMIHFYNETDNRLDLDDPWLFVNKVLPDGSTTNYLPYLMDVNDAFSGNGTIDLSTNPTPTNVLTYYNKCKSDNQYPLLIKPITESLNSTNFYLTGLKIVYTKLSNNDDRVDITWDDYSIKNNITWQGNIILNENLQINDNKSLVLAQGSNPTTIFRNTISGEFCSPSSLICKPGSEIKINSSGSITLEEKSEINLNSGSTFIIENSGLFEIKSGTTLFIEDCALLAIHGTGKIKIKSGANLCISPGAILSFENGLQNLEMESGVIIPNGYVNPNILLQQTIYNTTISTNTTWNNRSFLITGVITIQPNSTLIIESSNLNFYNLDSKIEVKPGAKLIINNSTLTNSCTTPWQGIEVWGNSTAHQWPDANGNYQQGRVILNNATIENATCALNLWKPGEYTKTGGIVHATGTTFKNNAKTVHALLYRNFHPTNGKEMEYNSWFNSCTFEITGAYPGAHTFYKHVDLNQVNGIKFRGCDFSLSKEAINISDYNQAIAAYSSGFKVDAICTSITTPCSQWKKSTFTDFRVGIYAAGFNSLYTYYINRAEFRGNSIGILSNKVNNPIIINSEFHAAKNQYNWEDCTYGIFVEAASGFTIEDNYFYKQTGAQQSNYIGIGAFNCPAVADIYRNTFTGLTAGNYAYGKNWAADLYNGLEYLCNTNTGNWADFYVTGKDSINTNGIQSKQGSTIMPAHNSFSPTGAAWHFRNLTKNLIGYYYCQSCPGNYPDYIENVTREPVSVSGTCPPHYGSGNPSTEIVLSTASKLNAETGFAFSNLNLQDIKTLYNNLKDGGSTEDTKADVATAIPSDMLELRAKLLGDSPHLSTEVLKLVADRTDVFTEAAIFDILAANPDELKKEELIKYLEEMENPLPDYMISILKQVAEGTSYRTVLEMEMAKYAHDRARAAGDIIRSILNAEELDVAQLRLWLTNLGGIDAERQIIASYAHQGDYTVALALAETLPSAYHLEGEALLDHNQFVNLLQLQQSLTTAGRSIDQLSQSEQDILREIAKTETPVSAAMAKAILESFYGDSFARCKSIDGTASYKSQTVNPNQLAQAYGLNISVKPNPASEWAAFDFTLPEGAETATLEVVDPRGISVETYILKGNRGQKLIDTRAWSAGQYVYTLKVAGFSQSGKLIVVK